MEGRKRAVAYSRVSTPEQKKNGQGIRIQMRDMKRFAKGMGLAVTRFYKDEAESGILEDRTELQKLLDGCKAGRIRTVIIPNLDRLSRDVRIAENLFWQFEQMGVEVLIADMPHYSSRDRKAVFLRQIREAIAEENRKEIIERLWKGRQERVRRGLFPGGNVPYGYRRSGKGLRIYNREAEIIKVIFDLAGYEKSGNEIAAALNRRGLCRRNGAPWTRRQVLAVLARCDLYTNGSFRYGNVRGVNARLILISEKE